MPESSLVTVVEVGPRDGLQNIANIIKTDDKIQLINLLSETGLRKIETSSFVSPKWVPQMADAENVFAGITRYRDVDYAALTPNLKGYEAARLAKVDEVAIFSSASETFSKKNINCSIEESLERFKPILAKAHKDNIPVRGYVSCIVNCPYEGEIAPQQVANIVEKLIQMGCYEISLGDTTGFGKPEATDIMLDAVLKVSSPDKLAGHFHDTDNTALDNITVSIEKGLKTFDAAIAGLGGCPYSPNAKGNVSTLSVVNHLHQLGYLTGINIEKLKVAEQYIIGLSI